MEIKVCVTKEEPPPAPPPVIKKTYVVTLELTSEEALALRAVGASDGGDAGITEGIKTAIRNSIREEAQPELALKVFKKLATQLYAAYKSEGDARGVNYPVKKTSSPC